MKRLFLLLIALVALVPAAYAQYGSGTAYRIISGTALPATCDPGPGITDVYVRTSGSPGIYYCSAVNTWTLAGGGGGGGTPGGADTQVQINDAGSFGGYAGFTFDKTSKITLGEAGTSVGAIGFNNATSGQVTVQPVTGALGTVTLSLPARTATVATTTGTLTSGRLAEFDASGNLIQSAITATTLSPAGVANSLQINNGGGLFDGGANAVLDLTSSTITLGTASAQNGRLQLRNSTNANVTNIISGAPASSLTFTLPATLPASAGCLEVSSTGVITQTGSACGAGGGGLTVGTTAIASGTATRLLYETSGNVLGEISGATSDGTNVTFGSGNLLATSPAITTNGTVTNNLAANTSGDGWILTNTGTASSGNQMYSPRIRLTGQGWKTTATAASQTVDWAVENIPVQGTANPGSIFNISTQINGGGFNTAFRVCSSVTLGSGNSNCWNNGTFVQDQGTVSIGLGRTGGTASGLTIYNALRTAQYFAFSSGSNATSPDLFLARNAAAHLTFGAADAASPVAQTLSVQNVVAGTTNTAGATATIRGSLGTSQGAPGRIHLTGGALIAASGTTQQTAVDRIISGATKVLTNNSAIDIVSAAVATETNAAGVIDYTVEITDGTDVQYEVGSVAYGVSNKGGVFSGNTATKFGNHQNATSGTLTVTFAISGANPALLSVNANSSLTPSTGYPRITYTLRNLTQQAVTVQ